MSARDDADRIPDKRSQIGPASCDDPSAIDADGMDGIELKIHQTAVRPKKNGAAPVDRQPRVRNRQGLAVGHFHHERHKRLAMDQLDDFFFHLFTGPDPILYYLSIPPFYRPRGVSQGRSQARLCWILANAYGRLWFP